MTTPEYERLLLASAIRILTENPRNSTMPAANAKEKAAALKAATKKAKAKGLTKYRHEAQGASHTSPKMDPKPKENKAFKAAAHDPFHITNPLMLGGTDTGRVPCGDAPPVVQSGYGSSYDPAIDPSTAIQENPMATSAPQTPEAQAAKEEATKAKIAAKEAKLKEAADKKAAAEAKKAEAAAAKAQAKADFDAKKAEAAAAKEAAKAEREQKAAENKAAREAAIAEAQANGSKRTYFGSMLNLAERVKQGAYVKGINGQLRSSDEVAQVLEACSPKNVVKLLKTCLVPLQADLANKYDQLNDGQQSMNLRNKLRGFIKAGKITVEQVKEARDAGDYADAEKANAEKAQKAAERKAAAELAKAVKTATPNVEAAQPAVA